ncbi:Gfo/Idh/MocA family oxidoreductase [Streptosporangium sp. NBC_01639]|uniref:Gfo/Idh/MocA family protein n=1 Tax=Streptosporangium sp. NBC_01639 TaxID=2975948 RepID=UPI003867FC61|nr:Gfo/Idh/MocA family oxidoreductase [Streptosporangium sp. NBC_01639]
MTELRLGLIGAGAVGVLHADASLRVPGLRVGAVCDVNPEAAHRVAAPHGVPVHADHRDLIASGEVDAVVVNTPHALHTAIVCDAAAAGLHVLVEKPMATSLADCDLMIDACAAAGVRLAVGHIQRFLPDKVAAMTALAAGEIGETLMMSDRRGSDYRPGSRPGWFLDPEIAGGGVFINIGAHTVDRLVWLSGRRVERVEASLSSSLDGSSVETDVLARLVLSGGLTAQVTVTSTGPPAPHDEVVVVGETGVLSISSQTGTALHRDGVTTWLHRPGGDDVPAAFAAQLADFADAVRDGREPAVTGAHGRDVLEVVLAAYASAASGAPVRVGAVVGQP